MLIVEPRTLVAKLSPLCRRAFERAAGASITARHREITVEHVLASLLDERDSDFVALLEHFHVDAAAARRNLQRYLAELRGDNSGKPVFSPTLLEWLQDSWVLASAEYGDAALRSGVLLLRVLLGTARYTVVNLDSFASLPLDELRKKLGSLTARTPEAAESPSFGEPSTTPQGEPGAAQGSDSALTRFASNLTERAKRGELDAVYGREAEVRQMVDVLCRRRKNNPILVGEPGVGKTALVEGLALRIAHNDIPETLQDTQILALDLGALQAGAGVKGEFEKRLQSVIAEVKASPRPMILFIDEAHTLIGAGGAQGGGDAANLLKPALARGELRTIAATTWAEYKRYFEKDPALERRFQPVKVDEPSVENAIVMLRGVARRLEEAHSVLIRDEAVRAAVVLSSRYISGRQLPDKAVDLLDTSASRIRVLRGAQPGIVEDIKARLAAVDSELAATERDAAAGLALDERGRDAASTRRAELHESLERWNKRLAAQRSILAKLAEFRGSYATTPSEPTRDAMRAELEQLRAIPPEERLLYADVDAELVESVVSDWTGIPVGRMVKDDVSAILSLEERLRVRVRGQDGALELIARELRAARSGLKAPEAPLGVFLLVGPSGVGKTETALALAELLFGGERFVVTINMSEFQERHSISRLIGSPPGYVGYGEGGMLTEAVRQRPYSVVLLDEVEKADREVMNLFYQVFDKGMLSDGEGRVIDFSNTVVILTSNLATDLITQAADPAAAPPSYEELTTLVKPTLSTYFKPALLARMSVVPYVPIRAEALVGIVEKKLAQVATRLRDSHDVAMVVDPAVPQAIAARCREVESGARNVDHIVRGHVLPLLSNEILRNLAEETHASAIHLGVDAVAGTFTCRTEQVAS